MATREPRDYRRGIDGSKSQRLWHFNGACPNYPTQTFIIEHVRPSDDDLCSRCAALGVG